ncbi:MAG: ribosome maturation factor RimM [Helicobacteraceae bacterium]|jgi:16S rRNA processing protein RimM|nr:ribosome maturation factor RimM [Helicobacteraceae bacterium]
MSARDSDLIVGRIGKPFGLKGVVRLRVLCDFPQFFSVGRQLKAARDGKEKTVVVDRADLSRMLIGFDGYNTPEEAAELAGYELFTTISETRSAIKLKENEHFWFDVIGLPAVENGEKLGVVEEIREGSPATIVIAPIGKKRRLIIPYDDHFIGGVQKGALVVRHCAELIEAL